MNVNKKTHSVERFKKQYMAKMFIKTFKEPLLVTILTSES